MPLNDPINWLLAHAEMLALAVNITICLACLIREDYIRAIYWLGATLVVIGLLGMKG